AFTISQIQLPVVLYNRDGKIIGVNFTSINDVKSSESRSFQVIWPIRIEGAVRAEVLPEVNTFDNKIYRTEQGRSPFDNFLQNEFNQ
ncbi:MAG TPA: FxLYD domain-containing protein, partial [Coxiellaceae bacterium]|nr:FxLYD domain-containing protein [Coxiellaceae bacterium]